VTVKLHLLSLVTNPFSSLFTHRSTFTRLIVYSFTVFYFTEFTVYRRYMARRSNDTHDHTMSSPSSSPYRPRTASDYVSIVVGHGSSALTLQTLSAPSIHAPIPDKAMAFDFLLKHLKNFATTLGAADLTNALANHFDVNHAVARSETDAVIANLKIAMFDCRNLSGVQFLNKIGQPIGAVSVNPADRPDDISFFVFDTTVSPASIDSRLSKIEPFTIRFALRLPQSARTTAPDPAADDGFATPDQPFDRATALAQLRTEVMAAMDDDLIDDLNVQPMDRITNMRNSINNLMTATPSGRRLFAHTPGPQDDVSPQMARILANSTTAGTLPTYLGSLKFLEDKTVFNMVFPVPVPLEDDGMPSDRTVPTSVAKLMEDFLGRCEFEVFSSVLRQDYVGSDEATSPESIRHVSDRIRRLSLIYQSKGQTITCRVDDLFKKYLSEVPVLPDDTTLWGFTLINYFWSALPEEMQTHITDEQLYTQPNMATLVDKTTQLNELRKL